MADVYTYVIGESIYVNLTNRCNNNCHFCIRNHNDGIEGYHLWLKKEPSVKVLKNELKDCAKYKETVFCGFGEPLFRLDDMLEVAAFVKDKGGKTRVNTNGQAEIITGRKDTANRMKGLIDTVNISLNGVDAQDYVNECRPEAGALAYYSMIEFAKSCVSVIPNVVLSVVDVIGEEKIEHAKKIAESIGAKLRIRKYI